MKITKSISIILTFVMFFTLSGCREKKVDVYISPGINKYSPLMSSVPGIPLNAIFNTNINKDDVKFHWVTEEGILLDWQQGKGKTKILGKDIKINEQTVYWSVDTNKKIKKSIFKIHLLIEDNNSSKMIYDSSIQIEQNKEGFFLVKNHI